MARFDWHKRKNDALVCLLILEKYLFKVILQIPEVFPGKHAVKQIIETKTCHEIDFICCEFFNSLDVSCQEKGG